MMSKHSVGRSTVGRRATYHHGDLRAALVTAALELVAEKGVAGLSVAEAARRAGVSSAAPYQPLPQPYRAAVRGGDRGGPPAVRADAGGRRGGACVRRR